MTRRRPWRSEQPSALGTTSDGGFCGDLGDSTCPGCVSSGAHDPPQHLFSGTGRKFIPVASSSRVSVQRRRQVSWFLEVFDLVGNRPPAVGFCGSNGVATSVGHEATHLHIGCAFTIESGPRTLGSTRREELQAALVVEDGVGGVDPTKADGFLDGLRVWATWSAGGVAPGAQPHTSGRREVVRQPSPPLFPGLGVDDRVVELPRRGVGGDRRR